ncbi:Histidine--tRNA ligase [Limihaloglobus sulfuriphilus]|uniref:Histidine--tRNA ligase n=1 Tax=Limihaloglobus sulfuriphilus TaxID=1851148 RepID=A0A1Q2MD55_9BACT|nr:histidine--tRNA ligase [Limihaloglobus sulfuriphilus]AQQ70633.1 Histidine--tRNA ligase [Limihaloglobus sulfuriphilus]
MKIKPVKGTRDFYPEQMRLRNWITDGWKSASLRCGFQEYDGPIFEYLAMYQQKSGDEIAEQLFSLEDRGGRNLAIRPEITPTLARMVNQKINALPRPIKWFSVPRVCRAERPQKGRLREFFQWNIDIIGVEDIIADAEVIFCAVDYLRSAGLTAADIVAKISSRKMLADIFESLGVPPEKHTPLYAVLDKRAKISDEAFAEMLDKTLADKPLEAKVTELMNIKTIKELYETIELTDAAKSAVDELKRLFEMLDAMGISDFCQFDISIVRGLAYYTGPVFEIHDRGGELRAVCGGGRFDNLLKDFGGPEVPATGMGMGDCVLEILLREKGLIDDNMTGELDYYIVCLDSELMSTAISTTAALRSKGFSAEMTYKPAKMGKQMKQAAGLGAKYCIILGQEYLEHGMVGLKNMKTGDQEDKILSDIIDTETKA